MRRCLGILVLVAAASAQAAELPRAARLGVVDAIAPNISAGFGEGASAARAPTVRDQWRLGQVAQEETIARLNELGYRSSAVSLPSQLADTVLRGGALQTFANSVRLAPVFGKDLDRWLRTQDLDGIVVLRSVSRPLEGGAPTQSGYGVARRGDTPVAYANLAPLLISGSPPTIAGAPHCLVTAAVDPLLVARPKTLGDLAPLRPAVEDVLRKSVDGALMLSGVMPGAAACE